MRTLAIVAVLASCTSTTGGDEPPLDPAPPEGGQQLASTTYTLAPGQEIYMCYQFLSPDDTVAITKVESIEMRGVHHIALYQPFGRNEDMAPHECNTLIKPTWQPIWAGGNGDNKSLVTPAGTGFVITPGTQYILQVHYQNASDTSLAIRAGVNLTYDHDPATLQPAGIYALGRLGFSIPAGASDYTLNEDCHAGKDMHVFAVFPHMHKIGTKLEVQLTPDGQAQRPMYAIDPWTFGNQPMDPLDLVLAPKDFMQMTCHYTNPGATPVDYGESSNEEMCFFVLFYYPFDNLDGCIDG